MVSVNNTTKLEHRVANLTARNEAIAVGRAAWGLFSLLSIWKRGNKSQRIALPSFLCQSPLAAILLAGWQPEFCDVDLETGNVSVAEWGRAIDSGVNAVLFVHLFGNVGDADYVSRICRSKGLHFIEDAAQSFGGTWEGQPCGAFGDAAIVSFGHTKLIDVGHGGMVLTNDSMLATEVRSFESNYARNTADAQIVGKQFRDKFYAARHQLISAPDGARADFRGLMRIYEPLIPSKWKPEVSEEILARLNHLDDAVQERREKSEMYMDILRDTALIPLSMSPGSVPWRATFRLPGIDWLEQDAISEAVRGEGVDISNWYIPSHWLIDDHDSWTGRLTSTEHLTKEIFQLWLDDRTDMGKVRLAASVLKGMLNEVDYG